MIPIPNPVSDGAIIIINKPVGPTSFDIVRLVKKVYPQKKVGHAGTLDPFAEGVLVILLGKATQLSDRFLNLNKEYVASLKLGEETDSLDRTGKVVNTLPVPSLQFETVRACVKSFEGEWHQTPPMFSAKKVKGVKLYEYARKNIEIPREKTPVFLQKMDLVDWSSPVVEFAVACSKGTYIRSLGHELAKKLGTAGHLTHLKRVKSGEFTIDEALSMEAITQNPQGSWDLGRRRFFHYFRQKNQQIEGLPRRFIGGNSWAHNQVIE
jgi:tRNA pseudouridine55 synthase